MDAQLNMHPIVEDTVAEGRRLFLEALDSVEPRSALDLGAGTGWILDHLRAAEIAAIGIEAHPDRLNALDADGHSVALAEGEALPFASASVDAIAVRHVLHHCRQPDLVLREAARVARRAIVISEQWWHPEHGSHRHAEGLDRWTKQVHRATGFHHLPALSAGDLRDGLSEEWSLEVAHHAWPVEQSVDDYLSGHARFLESLPEGHPLWDEGRPLIEEARREGLWRQGTLIAIATRGARA